MSGNLTASHNISNTHVFKQGWSYHGIKDALFKMRGCLESTQNACSQTVCVEQLPFSISSRVPHIGFGQVFAPTTPHSCLSFAMSLLARVSVFGSSPVGPVGEEWKTRTESLANSFSGVATDCDEFLEFLDYDEIQVWLSANFRSRRFLSVNIEELTFGPQAWLYLVMPPMSPESCHWLMHQFHALALQQRRKRWWSTATANDITDQMLLALFGVDGP